MNSDNLILSETKSKALQRSIFEQLRLMPYDNAENRALSDRFYRTVSPEDREEISKNLARYQYQPDPPEVVAKKARDLGIESEELINQAVIRYDAYEEKVQLQRRSKLENEESEERSKSIQDFENTIHKLGDNSDLATLQLIGHENVSIMRQNEKIIELLKDLLASKESFMSNQASQEAKWQQEEFDRLERLRNRQVSEQVKKELRRTKWERI